jgi:hypothetical protein
VGSNTVVLPVSGEVWTIGLAGAAAAFWGPRRERRTKARAFQYKMSDLENPGDMNSSLQDE